MTISRRNLLRFLALSPVTATGLATMVSSLDRLAQAADAPVAPSRRITLGMIGVGVMGSGSLHANLGRADVQVVAVCDVDRERREKAQTAVNQRYGSKDCRAFNDHRELLALPGLDAVWISTPDHWHAICAIDAANAGKHIYIEKPLSHHPDEGRAIVAAVRRAGVACQTGNWQRSIPEFQRAIDLARNGFLGRIREVQVGLGGGGGKPDAVEGVMPVPEGLDYDRWLGPAPLVPYNRHRLHWDWRWNYDYGGGLLTDWVQHHYDIAALAVGVADRQPVEIRNATAAFNRTNSLYDTPTSYSFESVYADGTVISTSTSHHGGVRLIGEEGWVQVNRGSIEHSSPALSRLAIPAHRRWARDAESHHSSFYDAIRTGADPRTPVEESHNISMIGHLANAAFRAGHDRLRWDPVREAVIDDPAAARFLVRPARAPYLLPA
jgi:predicted dehydrogenase